MRRGRYRHRTDPLDRPADKRQAEIAFDARKGDPGRIQAHREEGSVHPVDVIADRDRSAPDLTKIPASFDFESETGIDDGNRQSVDEVIAKSIKGAGNDALLSVRIRYIDARFHEGQIAPEERNKAALVHDPVVRYGTGVDLFELIRGIRILKYMEFRSRIVLRKKVFQLVRNAEDMLAFVVEVILQESIDRRYKAVHAERTAYRYVFLRG